MIAVEQNIVDNLRSANVIESSPNRTWLPLPASDNHPAGAVLVCLAFNNTNAANEFISNMGQRQ